MAEPILNKLENYFGINAETFDKLETIKTGNEIYIGTNEVAAFKQIKSYRHGIKLAQVFAHSAKFATGAIQLFGKFAQKNILQLSYSESMMFAQGQEFLPRAKPIDSGNGFVIVKYKQFPIGIGNYKDGKLKSSIPRTQVVRIGIRKHKFKNKRKK
jgi:NOL1/NOP2/fmu family ribosome biogenesis protein